MFQLRRHPWIVPELTLREALLAMAATSGHDPWAADSTEMSTLAVRNTEVDSRGLTATGGWAYRLATCGCWAAPAG